MKKDYQPQTDAPVGGAQPVVGPNGLVTPPSTPKFSQAIKGPAPVIKPEPQQGARPNPASGTRTDQK
jgi:hypothetical protein